MKNWRWIYTYDYSPNSIWEKWREHSGTAEWIKTEAEAVAHRVKPGLPCILLLTDSHYAYNGTWEDTVASMKELMRRVQLSEMIHLGDLTDGLLPLSETRKIEDMVMADMRELGIPVHIVPGNHDYNYFKNNPEIRYFDIPRYYVDHREQKLRLCFLDSFDPREEIRYGFSEEAIEWLETVLHSLPEGYFAIVFSHLTPLVRLQVWTDNIRNRGKLIDVLNRHADRVIAFINGHNHCDLLFNDLKNGQFPIVSINCAKCEYFTEHKPEGAEVPYRRLGDRTQESFDIMQVDTNKRMIYFIRFGAGRDRIVKDHKAFWID